LPDFKTMSSSQLLGFYNRLLRPEQQPLVSVITPVYNGEEYLAECIESVLSQTYHNWDYTIVNNRSTDRTRDIAQSYASKDSRIRIHDNTEFLPIMKNHNHAIRQISPQSKYCKVVLADDWLFPDCLMKMVSLAEENPAVGLVGAYGLYGDGVRVLWRGIPFPHSVVSGREACRIRLLQGLYPFGSPTATLIRSDFVRKQHDFYEEKNLHADSTACFRILTEADFGFVHQLLTFTRSQDESHATFTESMNSQHLGLLTELLQFGPKCLDEQEYRARLQDRLNIYYQVLAEGLLQMRGRKYFDFHRNWLRFLGIPLSPARLLKGFCTAVLNGLTHPLRALKALGRRWSMAVSTKSST
jgi:glycosyltransferase involved in cell wall biosynthesis